MRIKFPVYPQGVFNSNQVANIVKCLFYNKTHYFKTNWMVVHTSLSLHDKSWESWESQGSLQFSQRLSWKPDRVAQTFGRLRQGGFCIQGWIHTRTLSLKTKLLIEVAHICNSNVPEAEAGGLPYTWGKLELYKETLSQEVGAEKRGPKPTAIHF